MYNITAGMTEGFTKNVKNPMKKYYSPTGMTISSALSSSNLNMFIDCVYQAYLDASRKFVGINLISQAQKEACFANLAEKIRDYLCAKPYNSAADFDAWHKTLCRDFVQGFYLFGYTKVSIGMAQKVINLSFKYLYCCNDGATKYKDYFKYCHLTLDDYVLSWYTRTVDPKNKVLEWSTLNNYPTYIAIQWATRNYLSVSTWSSLCKTVLELEFYIFPDEFIVQNLISLRRAINSYSNGIHKNHEINTLFKTPLDPASTDTIIDFINNF